MSRRPPNPNADKAAHNQQALKALVKLESNKSCADCKKNKHPRWASWNLGIFICIRCSGIHRGMGTHISRVKSVDLDAWTDEQLQSMRRWGNERANKYWEAKLAQGHVPAEAKIENFIRTKYDSKRWVMEGGIPDPATLDINEEDDVPLNVVKEKVQLGQASTSRDVLDSKPLPQPVPETRKQDIDLFSDFTASALPGRPSSAAPSTSAAPPRVDAPAARASKPTESLLGFDFFGGTQANPPARPSSAAAVPSSGPSRPDLKQSILSLYSRAPSLAAQPPSRSPATPLAAQNRSPTTQSKSFGLDDAFSSLSFSSPARQTSSAQARSPAAMNPPQRASVGPPTLAPPTMTSGHFFDAKPAAQSNYASSQVPEFARGMSSSSGFGDFTSSVSHANSVVPQTKRSNGLDDLLGFGSSPPQPASRAPLPKPAATSYNSPFNLSAPIHQPNAPTRTILSGSTVGNTSSAISGNPWGSNDGWTSPQTSAVPVPRTANANSTTGAADWDWSSQGSNSIAALRAPQVTADEDFGGWESSTTTTAPVVNNSSPQAKRAAALGGSDDLFSNVWE